MTTKCHEIEGADCGTGGFCDSCPIVRCRCKPGETTGWTDDDMRIPRCNVCGMPNIDEVMVRESADNFLELVFEDKA